MSQLITTLGAKNADEVGMILPHEHIFVDLRAGEEAQSGEVDVEDVIKFIK